MKLLFVIALFIMLWPTVIFAQPSNTDLDIENVEKPLQTILDHQLDLDYDAYRVKQDWTFGRPDTRGYPQYEFHGVWRYAVKEIRSRFSREYRSQLLDYWNQSNDHEYNWHDYMRDLDEFQTGGGTYNWWSNRTWIDALPIEKGGAPLFRTITYGSEEDWFSLGPFVVTHDLKIRIQGTGIAIDGDQPLADLKQKYLADDDSNPRTVNIRAEPENAWYESDRWKFRFKPSANLKPLGGDKFSDIVRSVAAKAEVQMFTNRGLHFGTIEIAAQYDLQDEGYEVVAMFALLTW